MHGGHVETAKEAALLGWMQCVNGVRLVLGTLLDVSEDDDLHRLDESRHMATSLNLARLSTQVLDTLPKDNLLVFKAACAAAFPHKRSAAYRLTYWRKVIDEATIFADLPLPVRDGLYRHLEARIGDNLSELHTLQTRLTRQANKRIIEECGLSPSMKRVFVDHMRADAAYAATVDAVKLSPAEA